MTLKELQTGRASVMNSLDVPRTWRQREVDAYETRRSNLRGRIHAAGLAMRTLAEKDPQMPGLAKWMNHLVKWRKVLEKELDQIYDPRADGPLLGRINALKLSIKRIDVGLDFRNELLPANLPLDDLMAKDGYMTRDDWYGSLPGLEHQIEGTDGGTRRRRLSAAGGIGRGQAHHSTADSAYDRARNGKATRANGPVVNDGLAQAQALRAC
jgi:hypothetical protein